MTSKNFYINQATKKAERPHDAKKLDYIQSNISINSIRNETIIDSNFLTIFATREPDLILDPKTRNEMYLEHDTYKTHGELSSPNERTQRRNEDFARAKRPFFIINADLAKQLQLDEAKLTIYLYHHTISQMKAGVWD